MLRVVFIFCFLLLHQFSFSQDTVKTFLRGTHAGIGTIAARTNERFVQGLNLNVVVDIKSGYFIALRYYSFGYIDPRYPEKDEYFCLSCPIHSVSDKNFSVGKRFALNRHLGLLISTGPSYTYYDMPENIRLVTTGGFLGGYKQYNYDLIRYEMFGWSTRVDFNYNAFKYIGVGIGGFYNYNKMNPSGGVALNILVGHLK